MSVYLYVHILTGCNKHRSLQGHFQVINFSLYFCVLYHIFTFLFFLSSVRYKVTYKKETGECRLEISMTFADDAGEYSVYAKNQLGEVSASASLLEEGTTARRSTQNWRPGAVCVDVTINLCIVCILSVSNETNLDSVWCQRSCTVKQSFTKIFDSRTFFHTCLSCDAFWSSPTHAVKTKCQEILRIFPN